MSPSPLEIIAEELGAIAGRAERELRLAASVLHAEIRAEMAALQASRAEFELRAANAERALTDAVAARLTEVHDGAPGAAGTPGSLIYCGRGAPEQTGKNGDVYIDVESGDLYHFIF